MELLSELTSSHYRDIAPPVRSGPGTGHWGGPDGGCLQGEADQAGGEGDSSSEGTSQGKQRAFRLAKNLFKFLCLYSDFMIACCVHLISKSTFCVKQKKMIPLHNLDISVILIFNLPVNHKGDDQSLFSV